MNRAATLFAALLLPSSTASTAGLPQAAHAITPAVDPTASGCADFLGQLNRKPPHVRFIRCAYLPIRQGKPLRAVYQVDGAFAAATEAYLVKATGLHRLKRSCCQWDAPAHQFTTPDGKMFSVTMVSDETPVATRAEWRKIQTFEITVETLTEEI